MTETEGGAMPNPTAATCLVVDDDADLRRVIAHVVRRSGMSVAECNGLGDVLAALRQGRPVLVFLDAGLVDATASEVMEVLAEHRCDAAVQIVSGRSIAELERIAEDGEELGLRMLPPMAKPFRAAAVREVLDMVMAEPGGAA